MECLNNKQAAEVVAREMALLPANGSTVSAGTSVTFSGESSRPLTFDIASSEALLSSPDIDSGLGTQSGSLYEFTSTKAAATPRTVYWRASFTFTPGGCESPSTFTTPVRTVSVTPSEAELAAAKRQQGEEAAKKQEEEATKKKQEEEATKKKLDEAAAAGKVVLGSLTILVQNGREAMVKLTCSDVETCTGELTLTVRTTGVRGQVRHTKSETIGAGGFSLAPGEEAAIRLTLNEVGVVLLRSVHGRLRADLAVHANAPLSSATQTHSVRLEAQKPVHKRVDAHQQQRDRAHGHPQLAT